MTANPFERHGLAHLSASQLNLYRASPALWVVEYLLRMRGSVGVAAHCGTAVEAGVAAGLLDPAMAVENCTAIAQKRYRELTLLSGDAKRDDKGAEIPGMVGHALEALRPYGVPSATQQRIEVRLDDVAVPVIGFKDFSFDAHGLDVDLKTSARLPSQMSPEHRVQGAIYFSASGNREQRFCYATKAKGTVYLLEEPHEALAQARRIALAMSRLLALSADAAEIAGLLVPDYSQFRWSAETRAAGRDLYGI
jgi:hypothetical protein